jgi:hypothetical protein
MPIPKIVVTAALMVAQMAIGASRKIQGPRLENTKVTVAEYGTPIPRFWGIRKFEAPMPHAEEITVRKKKSKTKGGKYSEDRGFGTWMSLICDHEIEAVSRIWFDDRLVFQATEAGPVSAGSFLAGITGGSVNLGSNMRIYLGTEDQLPDPRYEAWCEDRYGPDSAPAYRGSAYVFFEDVPLANFGNRIPNVTIEAIHTKADLFPKETVTSYGSLNGIAWNADRTRMYSALNGQFDIWDIATRTRIKSGDMGFAGNSIAVSDEGHVYVSHGAGEYKRWDADITASVDLVTATGAWGDAAINAAGTICFLESGGGTRAIYVNGGVVTAVTIGYNPTHYFGDLDDNAWAVGADTGVAELYCVTGSRAGDALTVATGFSGSVRGIVNANGEAVLFQSDNVFRVDLSDGSVIDSAAFNPGSVSGPMLNYARPGATTAWLIKKEINLLTLDTIRTVDPGDWGEGASNIVRYDPINHALMQVDDFGLSEPITWMFLDRVANDGVTLKTIVDDVSDWCGVIGANTTALTQEIEGYSVSQGSGKDMIVPLLDIHDVDPRPHDDGLEFKVRGSASGGTLLTPDFVREGDSSRYTVTVQQDTDLPRRVTVNFADGAADQQLNTAISQRPLDAVDSNRDETIDLSTYVATPDEAQQLSDRRHRRIWNERERIMLSLTAQALSLEPGDIRTISLDGSERIARLDKMTLKGSVLDCEWIRDHPTLHNLNGATGAELEGRNPETIYIPAQTKGFVLDAPLFRDADNDVNPIIYLGAGSYGGTWPGAGAYRGDDGTYDDLIVGFDTSDGATWGYADEELDTANPHLWDRGNTFDVRIYGTLTSSTEAAIDIDPSINLIAVGQDGRWEYLNFTTATLTGTAGFANLYTLSGLKRGRRGTEANVANHEKGDAVVLLSGLVAIEVGTDEIGNDMSFKAQSIGRDVDAAPANDLTYDAASLMPYAPVIWHVSKDPSTGDIEIEVRSRTRIGGAWNGSTIPTGETSESYEFDVYRSAVFKRTLTSTDKTFTYTAADQVTDGGDIAAEALDGFAYQLSATVGRGFARAA